MSSHTETKPNPRLNDRRHSIIVSTRRRGSIHDRRIIHVGPDNDRPIVTHDRNRSGRAIPVMRISPVSIVAIGVTASATITFPTICQRNSRANQDNKSCNCEYFRNVAFHHVLLLPSNLSRWTKQEAEGFTLSFWKGCREKLIRSAKLKKLKGTKGEIHRRIRTLIKVCFWC